MSVRRTIARQVQVTGVALHAGVEVAMTLSPAAPGSGIVFHRSDLKADIPARYDLVVQTKLGTVIESQGARVGVVEHLLAATVGAQIDDLLVTLDGPEPPILDGDALCYLVLLEDAGVSLNNAPRPVLRILKPVAIERDGARAMFVPAQSLSFSYRLEFPVIGEQYLSFPFSPEKFRSDIAPARTFGFLSELESLHALNLARGASLKNTLALHETGLVNPERQRFADEFVRHKILDVIGDMALAGAPLLARFEGERSGHGLNNALLRALFAESDNFEWMEP